MDKIEGMKLDSRRLKPKRARGLPIPRVDIHLHPDRRLWHEIESWCEKGNLSFNEGVDNLLRAALHPASDDPTLFAKRLDKIEARLEAWHTALSNVVQRQLVDTHKRFELIENHLDILQGQVQLSAESIRTENRELKEAVARIVLELLPKSQRATVALLREILEGIGSRHPRAVRSWAQDHLAR